MKRYFRAWLMCQSMFCAIPSPQLWDEEAKDKMLLFLPVIGLEMGIIWVGLAWACRWLVLPAPLTALLLSTYPYLVSGFLHLDGYMDVTDAIRSWRDLQRRREILKDSHVGSFAVIGFGLLLLAQFACFLAVPAQTESWILLGIPAASRCCSALAVMGLKPMSTSQYAGRRVSKPQMLTVAMLLGILVFGGFLLCGRYGICLLACVAGYGAALRKGYRALEGMNGDISGYALTIGELCAVAVYALV